MSVLNSQQSDSSVCLCGSGQSYAMCCQPYHLTNSYPETAEQLMRSRYVAYAMQLKPYLFVTWAEVTRPAEIEFENGLSWQSLTVVSTKKGRKKDRQGWVTFTADYQVGLERGSMTEKSHFIRDEEGHWVYVDGTFI